MSTINVNNVVSLGDTLNLNGVIASATTLSATTYYGDASNLINRAENPTYKALLTQTNPIEGIGIYDFYDALIIGETYTILNYNEGDDFSNIANVINGVINQNECVFIATGQIPLIWGNGTVIVSSGNLVVDVLENSLGFDIYWQTNFGDGVYVGFNDTTGPLINSFPRNKTFIRSQHSASPINNENVNLSMLGATGGIGSKDDIIYLLAFDWVKNAPRPNNLYYIPIEVIMVQDKDTTPVEIYGVTVREYPFNYVGFDLLCGYNYINSYYTNDSNTVYNLTELVNLLNSNENTNQLGVFSEGGQGSIVLTIPTNLRNQLCQDTELRFEVYSD